MRPSPLLVPLAALALALSACSYAPYTPVRLPEPPAPASPAGVEHKDGVFPGVHGTQLYEQSWRPTQGAVRGAVIIVHGLKDHSGRYGALAERLAQQGFAVHAFDQRGHGRSEGIRVWVDAFDDYVGDLDLFVGRVRGDEPGRPVLIFGHSMGGAVAALYTITRKPDIKGLALSGAALATGVSSATIGGTKLVAALTPGAGVFQLDLDLFSRDAATVSAAKADPLVYQGGAAAHTARELLAAIGRVEEHMGEISVPILAMHGEADKVTPPAGSKALVDRASSRDKTLKMYPGAYHDLLHEPEREQVMMDLVKWLSDRAPAGPSGGAPAPPSGT